MQYDCKYDSTDCQVANDGDVKLSRCILNSLLSDWQVKHVRSDEA